MLAKAYSDRGYAAVHLLTINSYSLQHGEDRSARSNAYHLVRLGAALEFNSDSRIGSRAPQGWRERVQRADALPDLAVPADSGELTIANVASADGPDEHAVLVGAWAESDWAAWREHHDWARAELERPGGRKN